jgi:hypothetical protein
MYIIELINQTIEVGLIWWCGTLRERSDSTVGKHWRKWTKHVLHQKKFAFVGVLFYIFNTIDVILINTIDVMLIIGYCTLRDALRGKYYQT